MTATAMWAPIIAWCALETLAESIDAEKPERVALDAFDRLRLRQPLAESFNSLGFEGEAGWRAAARIKIVLLAETTSSIRTPEQEAATGVEAREVAAKRPESATLASQVKKPLQPGIKSTVPDSPELEVAGLARDLWSDPDVRWLTGLHDTANHTYLVCEPYEELLWWLQMPQLLRIAGQPSPSKTEVQALSDKVQAASAVAANAEYRLDSMLAPGVCETGSPSESPAVETDAGGQKQYPRQKSDEITGAPDRTAGSDSGKKEDLPVKSRK
jgi:hypothetical protein